MFLLDGYNLLHAMGILHGRVGPFGLQKARLGLLGLLHATYREQASGVTVVFDAAHAPPGASEDEEYEGIHIRWAVNQESADDLIESLITRCSAPKQLTVVSDDHRIQRAALRRHCQALGCLDYLEWLERRRRERQHKASGEASKPKHLSEEESQYWLRQFADLEGSPEMKKLFDPVEWKDIDE
jgi:predicted RNA-binding protein with PIN domain